ncbi:glycosyltransferase [Winogradskyella sp. SM1960]|uniref:glycosyltransferase n=1 Tax=Winogradskyella sp. SM1960 TaxID=2865955 RepID=UPI001CD66888|nr:glycosyltransferase [Winogradskyella sp. SM1960]
MINKFPSISETFVTNHILQAKLHGYKVIVMTNIKLGLNNSSQKSLLSQHSILEKTYEVDYKIPKSKIKRRIKAFFLIIKFFKFWVRFKGGNTRKLFSTIPFKLGFYHQFKSISVFHVQFAKSGLELAKMKSVGLLKGKIITTFHGYDAHFKDDKGLSQLKQRYDLLFKMSESLTVNTIYLRDKVIALGGNPNGIKVIPMGIDLHFFEAQKEKFFSDNSVVNLVSIGRLVSLKGFEYAINSVKVIVDKGYDVLYTIVGDGEEKDRLQQLIYDLELSNKVFLVGAKNQQEIKDLLEANHIFLMSSITDETNRSEAQGVVTAEAQAMGLPIVAFRNGGVPYTIDEGKTGVLVKEKDVEAYAEGIIKLIESPDLYVNMSKNAKEFVSENFCRETLSELFFKLYD